MHGEIRAAAGSTSEMGLPSECRGKYCGDSRVIFFDNSSNKIDLTVV